MYLGLDGLVLIIGLLMWVISANQMVKEIGKIMFFCGLLALLLQGPATFNSLTGLPGR